jgi:hypothetical protein
MECISCNLKASTFYSLPWSKENLCRICTSNLLEKEICQRIIKSKDEENLKITYRIKSKNRCDCGKGHIEHETDEKKIRLSRLLNHPQILKKLQQEYMKNQEQRIFRFIMFFVLYMILYTTIVLLL